MQQVHRLVRFLGKSPSQQSLSLRFFLKRGLSRVPFLPLPLHLALDSGEKLRLVWTRSFPNFVEHRPFWEYPGGDSDELRFVFRYLRPGMCFLDVGAYHGLFSVVAGRKLGTSGRIIAFEPSLRERRRARAHFLLNRTPVELEPFALSSETGSSFFYLVLDGLTTMNSLRKPEVPDPVARAVVPTMTLDEFRRERDLPQIDLMKVDVEGGELRLFKGASEVLARERPLIICEVLDWVTRPWGYHAVEIMRFLRETGYAWLDFRPGGRLSPHREELSYPEVRNYLAAPAERLHELIPLMCKAS